MNFKQIVIRIDTTSAEALSDIFFELGALSVTIEDAWAGTEFEQPIFDEPSEKDLNKAWMESILTILLLSTTNISELVQNIETLLGKKLNYETKLIPDEDWVRKTQSQFDPIKITNELYIVPSWHDIPDLNATIVRLDPGIAFGTGSHPTTFMCLEWLANNVKSNSSVLDYGCGSGILAIAAKKLGASIVCGTDIDNMALEASNNNAQENQCAIDFYLPAQLPQHSYDIVVANILANPLRLLAPALAKLTGNQLILSGILAEQAQELSNIYQEWFTVKIAKTMDEWVLLECTKR